MSINRDSTPTRNESPDREPYGFRGNILFTPLDLVLFEVDGGGSTVPSNSTGNTEFKRVFVKSGGGILGTIDDYDSLPLISRPYIKVLLTTTLGAQLDLSSYPVNPSFSSGDPIFLPNGVTGNVRSTVTTSVLFAGTISVVDAYEVDFGVLPDDFHGAQVLLGTPPTSNKLLGMLISTSKGAGSYSLVFPADKIV